METLKIHSGNCLLRPIILNCLLRQTLDATSVYVAEPHRLFFRMHIRYDKLSQTTCRHQVVSCTLSVRQKHKCNVGKRDESGWSRINVVRCGCRPLPGQEATLEIPNAEKSIDYCFLFAVMSLYWLRLKESEHSRSVICFSVFNTVITRFCVPWLIISSALEAHIFY